MIAVNAKTSSSISLRRSALFNPIQTFIKSPPWIMNPFITLSVKPHPIPHLWNFVFLYPTGTLSMRNSPVQNCLERETGKLVNYRKFSTVYAIRPSTLNTYLRTQLFEQFKSNSSRWRSSDRNIEKHHWISTTQTSDHLLIHRLSTPQNF